MRHKGIELQSYEEKGNRNSFLYQTQKRVSMSNIVVKLHWYEAQRKRKQIFVLDTEMSFHVLYRSNAPLV